MLVVLGVVVVVVAGGAVVVVEAALVDVDVDVDVDEVEVSPAVDVVAVSAVVPEDWVYVVVAVVDMEDVVVDVVETGVVVVGVDGWASRPLVWRTDCTCSWTEATSVATACGVPLAPSRGRAFNLARAA